jgi:hypothetical protein
VQFDVVRGSEYPDSCRCGAFVGGGEISQFKARDYNVVFVINFYQAITAVSPS